MAFFPRRVKNKKLQPFPSNDSIFQDVDLSKHELITIVKSVVIIQ